MLEICFFLLSFVYNLLFTQIADFVKDYINFEVLHDAGKQFLAKNLQMKRYFKFLLILDLLLIFNVNLFREHFISHQIEK